MKRRQFVKASLLSSGAVIGIGAGAFLLIKEGNKDSLTVDMALKKLDDLSNESLIHQGEWNPYQIFTHCAQSVEFSMSQFPEHKSDLFKSTVGKLAFSIFLSKGKMTHGLDEPIPSAPMFAKNIDSTIALNRLKKSLLDFKRYQGILAPHFAYGELSKEEYEIAHVMHLYNHLQEITS
ncbi:DUF1569 domain-containing protein [Colwellia hornerae]|uniref:DUF1569 domain-containing protein n=1 Tax=Colwellia hornerae TaxID=89402 RepID=A0A5C6Q3C9_9GAMM|nr:DUF1569 domain-containing protein [Colwellia hornerae]TWX47209.1 DUF1569 domain-containing protein [Colwellia hornerae]TWX54511.1 DUF1569 domain-containing protein [Colwellia hornerae]TWX63291.1 DUF1569 domain-containing protein [Colwellia hornerae]